MVYYKRIKNRGFLVGIGGTLRMASGTVKFFLEGKGKGNYGYITMEDGRDIFVHHTGIVMEGYKKLVKGQKVTFDVITEERGDKAINVQVVETQE